MNRLFALLMFPLLAWSHTYSTTSVEYLYGANFSSIIGGQSVSDGTMSTLTFEHASGWEYGSNYLFIDIYSAKFASGDATRVYSEWAPKLSLAKFLAFEGEGFVRDIALTGQLNYGHNFYATLGGAGVALGIQGFDFVNIALMGRKDKFNAPTLQMTTAWRSTLPLGTSIWVIDGFCDIYGVDEAFEVIAQPRLLLRGDSFTPTLATLQAGIELYYYYAGATSRRVAIHQAIPQLIFKWVW